MPESEATRRAGLSAGVTKATGFAIHSTNERSRLGGPASHGCVRLHPSHAAALFALVSRDGPRNTRIVIN